MMFKYVVPWSMARSSNARLKQGKGRLVSQTSYRAAMQDSHYYFLAQRTLPAKDLRDTTMLWAALVLCFFPDKRVRDPMSYLKLPLDALEGVAYSNDNQVKRACADLGGIDKENPRVEIYLTPWKGPLTPDAWEGVER